MLKGDKSMGNKENNEDEVDEIDQRTEDGFHEHWAIIWLDRLDTVYRYGGKCACSPNKPCPCDEMYYNRECKCKMIFMPEQMINNRYAKKYGIEVVDEGDYVTIKLPKIKRDNQANMTA